MAETAYPQEYLNYLSWGGNQLLANMLGTDTEIRGTDPATYARYVANTAPGSIPGEIMPQLDAGGQQIPFWVLPAATGAVEAAKAQASSILPGLNIDLGINWEELITRGGLILLALVVVAVGIFSLR